MQVTHKQVEALFERGTIAEVFPSKDAFKKRLLSGKPFHVYFGIDPTADKIHLGHVQNILFLEDLRSLGVQTTLLFGAFTGMVGDPSERETARKELEPNQVKCHMKTWRKQVAPILNLSWGKGARIDRNDRWYRWFSLRRFLPLLREVTVQQLLERDMFQKRLADGNPLYAHELIYPILQGYDSVAMRVDGELCGTDQTFNALIGRTFAKRFLGKEKFVITMNLIQAEGVLMSKSAGTGVFVDIEPGGSDRMFGAIMAVPDAFILPLYRGCTRVPMAEMQKLETATGVSLRDAKMRLAREIVALFWGKDVAKRSSETYVQQFQKHEVPADAPRISVREGDQLLAIVTTHAATSRSDARRKVAQGAVSVNGEKVTEVTYTIRRGDKSLRVGRHTFLLQQ